MNIISTKEPNGDDSVFIIINDFLNIDEIKIYKKNLDEMNDWKTGIFDGRFIPRLQKWFQDDNNYFSKNWVNKSHERWTSNKCDEYLYNLRNKVQKKIDEIFVDINHKNNGCKHPKLNSSLINYYRDGSDFIKYHTDDERIFGNNPTVAMLTFGVERKLLFKRIFNKEKIYGFDLNEDEEHLNQEFIIKSGSLFLMMGAVQKYYCHGIEKDEKIVDSRYSVTFREHFS